MSKPIKDTSDTGSNNVTNTLPELTHTHTIKVRWADCDPASIVYTGQIPKFSLEAIEAWWEHHAGFNWYTCNIDMNLGTPFVHVELDLRNPLTPRHSLKCDVSMNKLGTTSITFEVLGYQNEILCFEGKFVSVFVDAQNMQPRHPPEELLKLVRNQ